jgi:8-oxo-dGTP pyrophosphatase MutT (NUDIX family)
MMLMSFDEGFRKRLAKALAAFPHAPALPAEPVLKHAAVCIALTETNGGSGEPAFLLTRRAAGLRAHSRQWALPGGRCDPGETAIGAALRELHEELGMRAAETDTLGLLDDYPTRSGYRITPVVVWIADASAIQPNPDEVASVHHIPLAEIAADDAVTFVTIPQSERPVVRIRINGDQVHAPTAAILYQFRELLAGRHTRVAELEQPVFAWR